MYFLQFALANQPNANETKIILPILNFVFLSKPGIFGVLFKYVNFFSELYGLVGKEISFKCDQCKLCVFRVALGQKKQNSLRWVHIKVI